MKLEETIFNKYQPNFQKLLTYGFTKNKNTYCYQKNFFNNKFQAKIIVTNNTVDGKVIDLDINEEYLLVHSIQTGKFIDEVRNDYVKILKDVRKHCFKQISFYPDGLNHYWLIPANPSYFDIMNAFNDTDNIIWKQSTKIRPGDIVFMYVGSPVSAIIHQCKVVEANIPYDYQDKNLKITHVMRIQRIVSYPKDEFTFKKLANYDVRAIRGPRHVPKKLLKDLLKKHQAAS
ncbi:hypothetical protein [uncultured Lactobacillus sp.]|uniref:hypothetical protein n=1 Tax=uncultured Lactobacillus sp. TaxID=153152 RepID=UPI002632E968|nr:hypothetical protein [uncultured Lactobacillus sp.]